jgi:Tfp pilus assembly protein FimT
MKNPRESQLGYSAVELVVVVGIIGIFTLAAIPNFLQMYRQNELRVGARTFASDARFVRMQAIKNQRPAKMSFAANSRSYSIAQTNAAGTAWVEVREANHTLRETELPEGISVTSHTFVDISAMPANSKIPDDADSLPDLVYMPDGSVYNLTDADENIIISTIHDTAKPNFKISVRPAGNIKTANY